MLLLLTVQLYELFSWTWTEEQTMWSQEINILSYPIDNDNQSWIVFQKQLVLAEPHNNRVGAILRRDDAGRSLHIQLESFYSSLVSVLGKIVLVESRFGLSDAFNVQVMSTAVWVFNVGEFTLTSSLRFTPHDCKPHTSAAQLLE